MIEFLLDPSQKPTGLDGAGDAADAAKDTGALGRDDFLRMLVAQLENQDPLNPQDGTEFTAQLAQFSSLEQLIAMRESVDDLTASQAADRSGSLSLAAVGMIGREALVEADAFEVSGGRLPPLAVDLESAADSLSVSVIDDAGITVASWRRDTPAGGRLDLDWQQLSTGDAALPDGVYRVRVEALSNFVQQPAQALVRGRVTATTLVGDEPQVHVGPSVIPMSGVREVFEAEEER